MGAFNFRRELVGGGLSAGVRMDGDEPLGQDRPTTLGVLGLDLGSWTLTVVP